MKAATLISIITPVYNAERYLDETIRSVIAQSYPHWELLLVVDSKSSDNSLKQAKTWAARESRIKVLEGPGNLGVANNRNRGIKQARGEYIAFLDADDLWQSDKLKQQLDFMRSNDCLFSCHSYQQMTVDSEPLPILREPPPAITYSDLLKENTIGCLTVMIKSSLLKDFSFRSDVPHEDFVLWLEILKQIPHVHGLQENLALYRVLPNSRSGDKKRAAKDRWHLYRKVIKLSLVASCYYFACYVWRALKVRAIRKYS